MRLLYMLFTEKCSLFVIDYTLADRKRQNWFGKTDFSHIYKFVKARGVRIHEYNVYVCVCVCVGMCTIRSIYFAFRITFLLTVPFDLTVFEAFHNRSVFVNAFVGVLSLWLCAYWIFPIARMRPQVIVLWACINE